MAERKFDGVDPFSVAERASNSVSKRGVVPAELDWQVNMAGHRASWSTPDSEDPFAESRQIRSGMTESVKVSMNGGNADDHEPTPGEIMFPDYHGPRAPDGWPIGSNMPRKVGA